MKTKGTPAPAKTPESAAPTPAPMVDAQAEKKQRRIEKLKKRIAQHQAEIDTLERAEA